MLQRRRAKILRKLLHALDIKTCNRYTRYAYETLIEWQEMVQIQKMLVLKFNRMYVN